MSNFRIGYGYDAHILAFNRKLILGGVEIPYTKGLLGHSDADVLIHAICDALLGAAALGDIGLHFPDTSLLYKNIDSSILLQKVQELLSQRGYIIGNIDSTLRIQKPKIASYLPEIREKLAKVLSLDKDFISVKATTTEKMGFEGREEGISASVVVLIYSK
ncbi:MAG: 2-C-methyl-D-erythritol 2,4-cyclodiphosphate synthase [Bacteroidales bacterium]